MLLYLEQSFSASSIVGRVITQQYYSLIKWTGEQPVMEYLYLSLIYSITARGPKLLGIFLITTPTQVLSDS